jgi:glycosyltransferase involved in cell wall biosynthesis
VRYVKISIITVCYNASSFISETIESVLSQDYDDFEYLIVDGGSSDKTVEIIKRYADDPRLVWQSAPDRGISDAMNKGVSLASGDVVAHLNADDYYADESVLTRVATAFRKNPDPDWVSAGFIFVAEDGAHIRAVRARRYSYRRLVRGNILLHPATFISRELFQQVGGFDVSLRYCMDYDLFLRLGAVAPPLMLDDLLACFRVHGDSRTITQSDSAYAEEFLVRSRLLRKKNRALWPYALDYKIKSRLNRWLYKRLHASRH